MRKTKVPIIVETNVTKTRRPKTAIPLKSAAVSTIIPAKIEIVVSIIGRPVIRRVAVRAILILFFRLFLCLLYWSIKWIAKELSYLWEYQK